MDMASENTVKPTTKTDGATTESVTVVEVTDKKQLWKWVRFPNELYRDNECFVPFLENDEFDTFSSSVEKILRMNFAGPSFFWRIRTASPSAE